MSETLRIGRARHREGEASAEPLVPDNVYSGSRLGRSLALPKSLALSVGVRHRQSGRTHPDMCPIKPQSQPGVGLVIIRTLRFPGL